ncbi:hypothetical protein [Alkalispirochaeta alkalica]|uniref:hypothetical protein n=1 Tax=Alkalispirochaeta alkalica TaxID=46356 RepID=UPI00037E526F|nr:hypothetical protein [Alkalispirochaeta alkalica]
MWTIFWLPESLRAPLRWVLRAGRWLIARSALAGLVLLPGLLVSPFPAEAGEVTSLWFLSNRDGEELEGIRAPSLDDEGGLRDAPGDGWILEVRPPHKEAGGVERRILYYQGERLRDYFLRYRPEGTLREVRRCESSGVCVSIRFAAPDAPGFESIRSALGTREIAWDGEGFPHHLRREVPGELPEDIWYTYEEGRLVASRRVQGEQEILRRYRAGLLVREETRVGGRRTRLVTMERDARGTLVERITETRREVERERFYPPLPGQVVRRLWRGDALIEEEELLEEGLRRVTRFRGEEKLFRSWFSGDILVKREVFLDGQVVRTERPAPDDASRESPDQE